MLTKVAPSNANSFMGDFEETHVYTYEKPPLTWDRFIDDILSFYTHGREELDKFIAHLNSCHSTIKFTADISDKEVHFLDLTIKLNEDGTLTTSLYSKPTDSHNYLLYNSSHPDHCKSGMPYSQLLRVRRICSEESDFITHSFTMCNHFVRRGYPQEIVENALIKAFQKNRIDLLSDNTSDSNKVEDNLFVITTYQPEFTAVRDTIKSNWGFLTRSNNTKYLHDKKIIFGHRRSKNLKELLTKAKIEYPPKAKKSQPNILVAHSNPCKTKNCRYCPRINRSGRILSKFTKRTYSSKIRVDCKSNNLIYCITCNQCGIQYVGQTKRRLMDRFQGHFYKISTKDTDDAVGRHFNQPNHSGITDVTIHIVDFIHAHPDSERSLQIRRTVERNWQHRLHTIAPLGLNIQE